MTVRGETKKGRRVFALSHHQYEHPLEETLKNRTVYLIYYT